MKKLILFFVLTILFNETIFAQSKFSTNVSFRNSYLNESSANLCDEAVIQGGGSYSLNSTFKLEVWGSTDFSTDIPSPGCKEIDYNLHVKVNPKTRLVFSYFDIGDIGDFGGPNIRSLKIYHSVNDRLSGRVQYFDPKGFENGIDLRVAWKYSDKLSIGFNTGKLPFGNPDHFTPFITYKLFSFKGWNSNLRVAHAVTGPDSMKENVNLNFSRVWSW